MGINEIIMYIMMFFMLIAAVDRILSQFGGSARSSVSSVKVSKDQAVSSKKALWQWALWVWRWSV
ncbi:putative ethanolamine transporter [Escherichia coli]|uniref:Putative ethanolamine transporter n=1 Tax=Escherichia coli TaxID=562 RepID=A0A377BVG2_ECOLX|nr:putative ethanolamine transporter [Escherichia coli]